MPVKLNPKSRATFNWAKKEAARLTVAIDQRAGNIAVQQRNLEIGTVRRDQTLVNEATASLALLEPAQEADMKIRDQWRDIVTQYAAVM